MKIEYISANPGTGKTHWAINTYAKKVNALGHRILMVVPSKALADQIYQRNNTFKCIHSDTQDHKVQTALKQEIFTGVHNIVITEAAFAQIRFKFDRHHWVLIKDEAHEPLSIHDIKCPDSKAWILETFFTIDTPQSDTVSTVSIQDHSPEMKYHHDDIWHKIKEIHGYVCSLDFDVLVSHRHKQRLVFGVFQRPSLYQGFAKTVFMAANFEHTFLFHQWANQGVVWVNRTPDHLNKPLQGSRVNIHYWTDKFSWSKSARDHNHNLELFTEWFKSQIGQKPYVYCVNNDVQVTLTGERMPAVCHGLNTWRHHTVFMTAATYLVNSDYEHFYRHYGVSTTDVRALRQAQMFIQQFTRTNIRDYDSTTPIEVYVPTRTEARELARYLPGATLRGSDGGEEIRCLDLTQAHIVYGSPGNLDIALTTGHQVQDRYAKTLKFSQDLPVPAEDMAIWLLKEYARAPRISIAGLSAEEIKKVKQTNDFFTTGVIKTGRPFWKTNVEYNTNLLAFDFDDSRITDSDIKSTFVGCEYLKYTSVSDDPDDPEGRRCFRVVVPTDRAMTLSEHRRLMVYYHNKLQKKCPDNIGADPACQGAERKFYVPHRESQLTHVKRQKHKLCVDKILARLPKQPIFPALTDDDFRKILPRITTNSVNLAWDRACSLINKMAPGNRSHIATQVAGILRKQTPEIKQAALNLLIQQGIDKEAMRSVKKYMRL